MLADRRVWLVVGLVAVLVAARATGVAEFVSLDTLARHRATLAAWVAGHAVLARVLYVAVYAAAVSLSLPGAGVLTLSGGLLFGAWQGTALAVLGATTGATAVFALAQRLFGPAALERFGTAAQRLAAAMRREQVAYLLALRLVPLFPFTLVNLAAAFAGVGMRAYVATTLVGIVPGTAVLALAGAGLGDILAAGRTPDLATVLTPQVVAALCGLAALSLAAIPLRRWLARAG